MCEKSDHDAHNQHRNFFTPHHTPSQLCTRGTVPGLYRCPALPVIYSLVARGKTVLAEQQARSGNFPTITRMLLSRISSDDQRMSYVYDT